jgi:hypothetical protein
VGPRVGVLSTLSFVLALARQYSSPIFEHKSLVYHGLEILEAPDFQSIGKSIAQSIEETLLLPLIGIHIIWSVEGKLREMSDNNLEKCTFCMDRVSFLGYVVTP